MLLPGLTLAAIEFASLLWLGGLAAVALPILAHLFGRRRGRPIVFPSIQFLQKAQAAHRKRLRLRDLLLLIMRGLALIAMALAFAGPVWFHQTSRTSGGRGGMDFVLIVDRSLSMQRTHDGRPLFEHARQEAIRILQSINPARDRAAVIFADRQPESILPLLSGNVDFLIRELETATVSYEHADMSAALHLARQLEGADPATDSHPAREIHIFSDLQQTQWTDILLPPPLDGENVAWKAHRIGPAHATANLAATRISISPAHPIVGLPVRVSVEAVNFSDTPARPHLTLETQTGETQTQSISLGAWQRSVVTFPLIFETPGPQALSASLVDRDFLPDDRIEAVVSVRQKRSVGLLTSDEALRNRQGAFYLQTALAPTDDGPVEVIRINETAGVEPDLSDIEITVVCGIHHVSDPVLRALRRFVERGGGLWWITDSPDSLDIARRFDALVPDSPLLPVRLADWVGSGRSAIAIIDEGDFSRPPLRAFDGAGSSAFLTITTNALVAASARPGGHVALRHDTEQPALVWSSTGRGRIAIWLGPIDPSQCSLVRLPVFPAFVHELIAFLDEDLVATEPFHVGDRMVIEWPAEIDSAESWRLDPPRPYSFEPTKQGGRVWIDKTHQPGIVRLINQSTSQVIGAAAVTLDERESDMRPISMSALDRIFGRDVNIALAGPGATNGNISLTTRTVGLDLWPMCIVASLLFLAMEMILAARRRADHRAGRLT